MERAMKKDQLLPEIERVSAEIVKRFDAAWNGRDAKALGEMFTEDADFQFYYGLLVRGRERIQKYYAEKVFPYLPEKLRHFTRSSKVRAVAEGVLIGDGKVDLVEVDDQGAEIAVQRRVKVTTVVVKEGGQWKFAAARVMVPVKE
jgi:uncharacterized protein (TIGR02246 family)